MKQLRPFFTPTVQNSLNDIDQDKEDYGMELGIEDVDMENALFVYVVHGLVPEFMPHAAFRREKHFQTANKKIIKCPYCRNTFTTVDENEKIFPAGQSRQRAGQKNGSIPCVGGNRRALHTVNGGIRH